MMQIKIVSESRDIIKITFGESAFINYVEVIARLSKRSVIALLHIVEIQ